MRSEYVSNRFIFNIENSNRNDIKNKNLYLWFSFFWPHFIPFAWFSTFIVQTTKRNVLIKIHVSQPGWWRELNSWIIRWCDVKLSQYDVAMELQYRGLSWLIPKRVDSCSSIGYGCKLASHGAKKTEMCLKKKEKKPSHSAESWENCNFQYRFTFAVSKYILPVWCQTFLSWKGLRRISSAFSTNSPMRSCVVCCPSTWCEPS